MSVGSQHDAVVYVWDWKNNVKVGNDKLRLISVMLVVFDFTTGILAPIKMARGENTVE